ncbi:hypothetical protein BT69DRAFT_1276982 [Atractiella rhizophila]|nr:hypothetical protein BT69DRAFT_1276982 [Atractiella rhizophila]
MAAYLNDLVSPVLSWFSTSTDATNTNDLNRKKLNISLPLERPIARDVGGAIGGIAGAKDGAKVEFISRGGGAGSFLPLHNRWSRFRSL